jgi:hypothetical protein
MERSAIEEDGIHAWPAAEKVREVAGDGAVSRIRKRPFSEPCLRAFGTVIQLALGKEPVEDNRFNFVATDAGSERFAQQAGTRRGNRDRVVFIIL